MDIYKAFQFLKALKKNNKRDWFQRRKPQFDEILGEFELLVDELLHSMVDLHPDFLDLKPRDCMFRIYRDVRFSKDKSPYKAHLSAFLAPGGRKAVKPGYYIHLEPGQTMIAGGWYMPSVENLQKIRKHILDNGDELQKRIKPLVKKYHLEPFDKLARVPRGFPADHLYADWLKLKHFVLVRSIPDSQATSRSFKPSLIRSLKTLHPFCIHLEKMAK